MTVKELMEYLNTFDKDEEIAFLIANIDKRKYFPAQGYEFLKDDECNYPLVMLEVAEPKPLDELTEARRYENAENK